MEKLTFAALVLGWITVLLWGSKYIEWLWVRALGVRAFRLFVAPGIIVHEYSHALACLLTGTKIHEIKLFKRDGGHVKHEKPNATLLGLPFLAPYQEGKGGRLMKTRALSQFLISFAPVMGCLACIWLMGIIGNAVMGDPAFDTTQQTLVEGQVSTDQVADSAGTDLGAFFFNLTEYIWNTLTGKLIKPLGINFLIGVIYLWLLLSFTVAMAPSERDFLNSVVGIVLVVVLLILVSMAIQPEAMNALLKKMLPMIGYTLAVMLFATVVTSIVAPTFRGLTRGSAH
ncbi:MAG: M50 family metallopeptidase [Planctomycetota bacterium]